VLAFASFTFASRRISSLHSSFFSFSTSSSTAWHSSFDASAHSAWTTRVHMHMR
jgi:hypothetical protein